MTLACPYFQAAGARASSAGATTLSPAKPTVLGVGGKLYAVCQTANNAAHATATAGWSLVNQTNSGASFTASLWEAAEGAAAPVFTWTGSVGSGAQVFYFINAAGTVDTNGGFTVAIGTTAAHASTPLMTTRANSLVAYIDACTAVQSETTPTGWTQRGSIAGAGSGRLTLGDQPIDTSGTSAGAATPNNGVTGAWVIWQLEIRSTLGGPFELSKAEFGGWAVPFNNQASLAKAESDLWLIPNDDQNRYSKISLDLWLVPGLTRRPRLLFSSL